MLKTNPFNIVFTLLMTIFLNVSYSMIFAQTFNIYVEPWQFAISAAAVAVIFLILNMRKSPVPGIIGLSMVLLIFLAYFDKSFGLKSEFKRIFEVLRYRFTAEPPVAEGIEGHGDTAAFIFSYISIIPAYAVTWSLLRKHNIVFPMLCYACYFLPSMFDSYSNASAIWYVFAISLTTLLVINQCMKKANATSKDATLALITIPVFLICLIISFIFPMNGYDMEEVAYRQYDAILTGVDKTLGTDLKLFIASHKTTYNTKSFNHSAVTELEDEGNKQPSDDICFKVYLNLNDGYELFGYDKIYLRSGANSLFDGKTWKADTTPKFYEGKTFFPEATKDFAEAGWITIEGTSEVNYMPYPNLAGTTVYGNTDPEALVDNEVNKEFFAKLTDEEKPSVVYPEDIIASDNLKIDASQKIQTFSLSSVSAYTDSLPKWNSDYVKFAQRNCTFVPTSTVNAILNSRALPDWYMEVYNGERTMTNREKVEAVMYYVYSIAPYDLLTEPVPEGKDFVAWFISEAQSGYCVHYATTAAILLRMLDVPTRYVSGFAIDSFDFSTNLLGDIEEVYDPIKDVTFFFGNAQYEAVATYKQAHAWCEFFDPELGWVGFDPTNNEYVDGPRKYTPPVNPITDDEVRRINRYQAEDLKEPVNAGEIFNEIKEEASENIGAILLVIASLAVIVLIAVRVINAVKWRKAFTNGSNNDRVRAMCRYALEVQKRNSIPVSANMSKLTEYAMYRREEITGDELSEMTNSTREYLKKVLKERTAWQSFVEQLIYYVPV